MAYAFKRPKKHEESNLFQTIHPELKKIKCKFWRKVFQINQKCNSKEMGCDVMKKVIWKSTSRIEFVRNQKKKEEKGQKKFQWQFV